MSEPKPKLRLFISYAHRDEAFFKAFNEGLKSVVKNTKHFDWHVWEDTQIHVGDFWDETIQDNIKDCDVALLLVSVGFMASKYIEEREYAKLVKKYSDKGVLLAPILFAPCEFSLWEDLGKIQFFKPQGSVYGKPELGDRFTYADLVTFTHSNGMFIPIPNPNLDRYYLDLVSKVESSYKEFLAKREESEISVVSKLTEEIPAIAYENRLKEFPSSKSYFTGREDEIRAFKEAIDAGTTFIAFDGPGGIGKTQIVSKCIETYLAPEKIIWYTCTTASQLDTLISDAGYPELLKGGSKTDREKFSAFKDKIQENGFYLFLDDFQEVNGNPVFKEFLAFIQEYLKRGCVVVLDRDDIRSVSLNPKRIHVEGLVEKRLEFAKAMIKHGFADVKIEDAELEQLCDQLQGYPFAIYLAILLLSAGETPHDILAKIAYGDEKGVSERLLNEIFTRADSTQEEKDFITQFSAFIGKVDEKAVLALIPEHVFKIAPKRLLKKNLLTIQDGNFEIHPLVREFCYKRLEQPKIVHSKIADYYVTQRTRDKLNPSLEEQIFYHLSKSERWDKVEKEIVAHGRQFILNGQHGLIIDLLEKLKLIGVEQPIFNILCGDIAEIQGRWDDAQRYYDNARLQDLDKRIKTEGTIKYGEMLHRKGNLKEALVFYEQAKSFSLKNQFEKETARALNDIGLVYEIFGNIEDALEKHVQALKIRRGINDNQGIGISLNAIAYIYMEKENLNKALSFFEESMEIRETIGDMEGIASSYAGMGSVWTRKKNSSKALNYYQKALEIYKLIGSKAGIAASFSNIATFLGAEHFDEALDYYNQGLTIKEELGEQEGIAITLGNIGILYFELSKPDFLLGFVYSFRSMVIYGRMGANHHIKKFIKDFVYLRDHLLGLNKFKNFALQAYDKIEPELQKYIPLQELLKEPITRKEKKYGPNEKVSVRYFADSSVVKDVKYKKVKDDIEAGRCEVVDE